MNPAFPFPPTGGKVDSAGSSAAAGNSRHISASADIMKHFVTRVLQAILDAEVSMAALPHAQRRPAPSHRQRHPLPSCMGLLQLWSPRRHSTQLLLRFAAEEPQHMRALRKMLVAGHLSGEAARTFAEELCGRSFDSATSASLAAELNGAIAGYMCRQLEVDYPRLAERSHALSSEDTDA